MKRIVVLALVAASCAHSTPERGLPLLVSRRGSSISCATWQRGVSGAIADTTISQGSPSTNDGASPEMWSGTTEHGLSRSLVWFDLSPLPKKARIVLATVSLYVGSETRTEVKVHRATSDWHETSATWDSFGD